MSYDPAECQFLSVHSAFTAETEHFQKRFQKQSISQKSNDRKSEALFVTLVLQTGVTFDLAPVRLS